MQDFFLRLYLPFLCLPIEKKWRQCSQATMLAQYFRIDESYENLIYYKRYVSCMEGVSCIEGVKHKYKKHLDILSCVEIS